MCSLPRRGRGMSTLTSLTPISITGFRAQWLNNAPDKIIRVINWLEGWRASGEGAFLNAARFTASKLLFAATPLCCWALPRPAAPAFLAHRPLLPGFRYLLTADRRLAGTWNVVDGLN